MKRILKIALSVIGLFVGVILLLELNWLVYEKEEDPTEEIEVMGKDLYNQYGLLKGVGLSNQIIDEDGTYICYEDRILKHFSYEEENAEYIQNVLTNLTRQHEKLEKVYVMPIPTRIVSEVGYEEDLLSYERFLKEIEMLLPKKAELVNVLPILQEHENENLFYRTEEVWTARGAYYGSTVLCKELGIEPFTLDAYNEYLYNSAKGQLLREKLSVYNHNEPSGDPRYYYLLPDAKNREEIFFLTEKNGKEFGIKKPVITIMSGNLDMFVGGGHTYAIVEGGQKNQDTKDKSILLVCDEAGDMLASYLADYYKQVYVVNIVESRSLYGNIEKIIDTYHITDMVYAQNAQTIGERGFSRALNPFYLQSN